MVFFAFFDPVDLIRLFDPGSEIGRDAGYAVGFFFFWMSLVCSGITAFLVRTAPKRDAEAPRMNSPSTGQLVDVRERRRRSTRARSAVALPTCASWRRSSLLGLFLPGSLADVGRAPGDFVRPAGTQVLSVGLDALAAGFSLPGLAAHHRRLSLFFFTALAGRLWCGFACPQTVWTEAFIWMEQLTEGTRSQRMKLDKAPWTWNKIRRKGSKQFSGSRSRCGRASPSSAIFEPIRELGPQFMTFTVSGWTAFWGLFYGFATYGNAGYMREQVCKYMCPYARFQSAMFDKDTLIISYDEKRGEPRGGRKRSVDPKLAGSATASTAAVRAGLPHRHRHSRRTAVRMHRLRRLHRCLRLGNG